MSFVAPTGLSLKAAKLKDRYDLERVRLKKFFETEGRASTPKPQVDNAVLVIPSSAGTSLPAQQSNGPSLLDLLLDTPISDKAKKKRLPLIDAEILDSLDYLISHPKRATVSARQRYMDFALFLQQNHEASLSDRTLGECAVAFLLHRQKENSLKASSCCQYGKELRAQCHLNAREQGIVLTDLELLSRFIDEMGVLAMHEPTAHAIDVTDKVTAEYVTKLATKEHGSTAVLIWLIAVTSARPEDLINVQTFRWEKRADLFHVNYGPTKNRKKACLQFSSSYSIPEILKPSPKLESLLDIVKKGCDVQGRVLSANDLLKKKPMRGYPRLQNGRRRHPTTFSFRRLAIQRFIEECTDDTGFVDYEKVIRKSGHLDMTMPANIYSKKAAQFMDENGIEGEV